MFVSSPNWHRMPPTALPVEPEAIVSRSSSTTSVRPSRARWNAVEAPTAPAPITTTSAVSRIPELVLRELGCERGARQRRARGELDVLVPAQAGTGTQEPLAQQLARRGRLGGRAARAQLALQRGLELGGGHLAEQVVVVVDRRDGQVDLGRPVPAADAVRAAHALVALDVRPPRGQQVLRRV